MKTLKIALFGTLMTLSGVTAHAMDIDGSATTHTTPQISLDPAICYDHITFETLNIYALQQDIRLNSMTIGEIRYNDLFQIGACTRNIVRINVKESMRGKGFGTQAMNLFIKQSTEEGVRYLSLTALDEAMNFYKRLNFTSCDGVAYRMRRELNPSNPYKNKN